VTFRRSVASPEGNRPTVVAVDVYSAPGGPAWEMRAAVQLDMLSGQRVCFTSDPNELREIATMLLEALRVPPVVKVVP
jgi:hypothetical protein